ncbi:DUF6338 family protein [Rhodococcus sp. NPDC127530]|uniref:DUF6338 family protein n=1 Tax=unclassified Rhodococcus (in: high G+C Gram-positive bacteria) TaxID=192944 RepID=UPI00362C61F8
MLARLQALAVFVTSILPGALFTFAFERENKRTTTAEFNERLLTFASTSALFGMLSTPLLYQGYRIFVVTGDLQNGEPLPWWVWAIAAGYVVVPLALGALTGMAARKRWWWARPITGPEPEPRGWDLLFKTPALGGYVKLRLKEPGTGNPWIMGLWAKPDPGTTSLLPGSYAAGYPYEQDLYLIDTCQITPNGTPVVDASGNAVRRGSALLVRWSEVAYAEFIEG